MLEKNLRTLVVHFAGERADLYRHVGPLFEFSKLITLARGNSYENYCLLGMMLCCHLCVRAAVCPSDSGLKFFVTVSIFVPIYTASHPRRFLKRINTSKILTVRLLTVLITSQISILGQKKKDRDISCDRRIEERETQEKNERQYNLKGKSACFC